MKTYRKFLCLFLFLPLSHSSNAQEKYSTGKITYEYIAGNSQRIIDMWFTASNYLYQYRTRDAKDLPAFKDRKYASAGDSLKAQKIIDTLNQSAKKAPVQNWYGQMGDNVVVYSSFDNNLKTYCVRDTMNFTEWQLLPDTSTIKEIKCQKALGKFGGMNYVAWFAISIPIPVAPLQFRGLPGLLVEVVNTTNHASISMIELEWPTKDLTAIKPCSGSPFVSKQEMQNILSTQFRNVQRLIENNQKVKKN